MAQAGMFRQDITDLAGVSMAKLKVYGPIYGIVITVCVTVFVEGRSGLKFPGPPVFISQIYLQCLGIGMSFMALATWLLFHASMRAQVACVQLRTRQIRLPVPTQRQLDSSRKLASTYEEQGLYDMFRIPFVMPNGASSPENSEDEEEAKEHKGYSKGGIPGAAAKVKAMAAEAHKEGKTSHNARMPGFTPGVPSWYAQELGDRETFPQSSPSAHGMGGEELPYEHFEMLRNAQKEWWGAEAYMRICFLYGMIHLIMAFSYWITLHNICELGMIWCSNLGAAGLTAGVWIIFRMDVLPEHGGAFPFEIGGPFVTSITLGLMYSHNYTQTMIDVARGVAAFIILMHVGLCFRMYSVAKPAMDKAHHTAKEAGGRLFNESGSCDSPSWLPTAFQHVMYLVAPPKTQAQLDQEKKDRENVGIGEDPLAKVDMAPWKYTRIMIAVVALGWFLQLAGHTVECIMGERMLVSNPGAPPWSRTGQWYGWEHGPVSSKHYAHVTPQRGHWAWQRGWGPQGQQELWASDMFGFHPEADAWWAEPTGPEPLVGAAGFGENTWATGVVAYGQNEPAWGTYHKSDHNWLSSGGHRRLSQTASAPRSLTALEVQWPELLEPDFLACGSKSVAGKIGAFTSSGFGATLDAQTADGALKDLSLEGLAEYGMARSATWGEEGLLLSLSTGKLARCMITEESSIAACSIIAAPALPYAEKAAITAFDANGKIRAAVSTEGLIQLYELRVSQTHQEWHSLGQIEVSQAFVSVTMTADRLLALEKDGTVSIWKLRASGVPSSQAPGLVEPVKETEEGQQFQGACLMPGSKILRLASKWYTTKAESQLLPQLLF